MHKDAYDQVQKVMGDLRKASEELDNIDSLSFDYMISEDERRYIHIVRRGLLAEFRTLMGLKLDAPGKHYE
jgi:hypothetical protein